MPDRSCPLDGCQQTLTGPGRICPGCLARTRLDLRDVPRVLPELDLAISGQTAMSPGGGRGGCPPGCTHGGDEPACVAGVRLVLDERASQARLALVLCVDGWARVWGEEHPVLLGHSEPERARALSSTTRQAQVLYHTSQPRFDWAYGWWPREDWAPDLARELHAAIEAAWTAVDRPAESRVAGLCPACHTPLYVREGATWARCTACGESGSVEDIRAASLAQRGGALLTAQQIAAVLGVPYATVRGWRHRGALMPAGELHGHDLYRLDDATALRDRGRDAATSVAPGP